MSLGGSTLTRVRHPSAVESTRKRFNKLTNCYHALPNDKQIIRQIDYIFFPGGVDLNYFTVIFEVPIFFVNMALLEKSFENVAEKNDSFDLKLPGNKIKRSDYIEIEPKPSFALKTSKLHENIKTIIYINVCSHESIYEPGPKKSIDVDGNEIEGLNVPISIGDGHNYEREDGSNSLTYDIIVNPKVLEECGTDKTGKYRDFICKLILQSISQKFKVEIDYKYQIIKKKYIGIKKSQFVRKSPSQPVIEEITTEQKENLTTQSSCIQTSSKIVPNKTTGNPREQQNAIPEFHYKCYLKPNTHVSSQINLPDVPLQLFHNKYVEPTMKLEPSYSHIVLDCTFKSILTRNQLSVTSSNYRLQVSISQFFLYNLLAISHLALLQIYSHGSSCLDLYIPFTINPSCTRSSITTVVGSVRQLLLTVVMEIENSPWDKHVDPGSRAWLVSQAIQNDHTHNDATSTSASLDEDSKADVSTLKNNTVISGQTSKFSLFKKLTLCRILCYNC